jgi:hypothetical protein
MDIDMYCTLDVEEDGDGDAEIRETIHREGDERKIKMDKDTGR